MAKDTKERILAAALDLFAQNGYTGTNIRELTASLGLVKSSMYRHFESKEEIWTALLDEMTAYYDAHFGSPENLPPVPASLEELAATTMQLVKITVHDGQIVKVRKLLTIEQFRDDRARELATKHFLTGLTNMFTCIFAGMMDKGLLRRDDPAMLAFAYTAPISALIHLCDREPEKTGEAMVQVEAFVRHFIKTYGVTEPAPSCRYPVRPLEKSETGAALQLAWKVFCEYDASDFEPEGTEEFKKALNDNEYLRGLVYYGAFNGETLIGMLGVREEEAHVCLFFVDGAYHRRGVGTALFERMLADFRGKTVTVNASPYGLPFYRAFGFTATGSEQTLNGIRFTPMEYKA